MDHAVFISYSTKDKDAAEKICRQLEHVGITCWIAPRDVKAGQKYGAEIIAAIKSCKIVLLIASKNSVASEHVQIEIERATGYDKVIIPYRIEQTVLNDNMEYFLSSKQWIDAFGDDNNGSMEKLMAAVRLTLDLEYTDSGDGLTELFDEYEDDETVYTDESSKSTNAKLCLVSDVDLPSAIYLNVEIGGRFTIGRFDITKGIAQNDFEFPKETKNISRRHAIIERTQDGYVIIDAQSKAGTYIDGTRIAPGVKHPLARGSRVSFGRHGAEYIFES